MDHIGMRAMQQVDLSKIFRVKIAGKDKDPMFWSFGKIHGLENIAFADPEEIKATNGNPVKIQKIVNKYDGPNFTINSFEHLVDEFHNALANYKKKVESIGLNSSDQKKLLALPFYMVKRQELPEPRRGQNEFELFKELTGNSWYKFADLETDLEKKITEFDYENYIDPALLKNIDTSDPSFKEMIKIMNLASKTEYELHQEQKEAFKELMPMLKNLNADEQRALIHKLRNSNRKIEDPNSGFLLDILVSDELETKLAKISEDENYALKNRYRHQRQTMDYAEKKRMPVDATKVKDILRN